MTRPTPGRLAIATAGLAAALLLAACGSSSTTATPGTSSGAETPSSSAAAGTDTGSASSGSASGSSSASASGSESSAPASDSAGSATGSAPALPAAKLTLLFGSSGAAETAALTAAGKAWSQESGSTVTVTPAQNLVQQLAQGFSSGNAPDLFYVGAGEVANYASAGNLLAYGDSLANKDDFYPALKDSFTYDGKFYCAPKDFSTLALFINTDMWTKAGLTDADIPKSWDQLAATAKKLTVGKVAGLSLGAQGDRFDAFMVQNGSYLVDKDNKATVNDPKNLEALTYIKKLYTDGSMKFPKDLGAGWAGEAFGKGEAAMTIEGSWLLGSMKTDYPGVKFKVAELPAGPSGTKGTLSFTNCWGISATTKNPDQAKALVTFLTSNKQQLAFADAFGVIPSVQSAQADYLKKFPANAPFVKGVEYAKGVVSAPKITDVIADFDTQLQGLGSADPKAILDSVQDNLKAALGG